MGLAVFQENFLIKPTPNSPLRIFHLRAGWFKGTGLPSIPPSDSDTPPRILRVVLLPLSTLHIGTRSPQFARKLTLPLSWCHSPQRSKVACRFQGRPAITETTSPTIRGKWVCSGTKLRKGLHNPCRISPTPRYSTWNVSCNCYRKGILLIYSCLVCLKNTCINENTLFLPGCDVQQWLQLMLDCTSECCSAWILNLYHKKKI